MTESKKIDIKTHIEEVRMTTSIHGNKIAIHESILEDLKKRVTEIESKKDATTKLAESHKSFGEVFKTNSSKFEERLQSTSTLMDERFKVQSEMIEELSNKLDKSVHKIGEELSGLRDSLVF